MRVMLWLGGVIFGALVAGCGGSATERAVQKAYGSAVDVHCTRQGFNVNAEMGTSLVGAASIMIPRHSDVYDCTVKVSPTVAWHVCVASWSGHKAVEKGMTSSRARCT